MRWFRNVISVILVLLVLSISAVGLMVEFPSFGGAFDRVRATGEGIVAAWRPGYGLFFLWLGLLCGTLLSLLLLVLLQRRRMHVEVETADGRVCILDSAIKRYLQSALTRVPGVITKRVLLKHGRRGLLVEVYVLVRSHERLIDLKQQLIDRARRALTEDLGITSLGGIDVLIEDFEARQKSEPPPVPAPAPMPPEAGVPGAVVAAVPADIESSPFVAPRRTTFSPEPDFVSVAEAPSATPEIEAPSATEAPTRSRGLFGRWRRTTAKAGDAADVTVEAEVAPDEHSMGATGPDADLSRDQVSEQDVPPDQGFKPKENEQ